jgi:GNAT superfamily N-acetyltransferase
MPVAVTRVWVARYGGKKLEARSKKQEILAGVLVEVRPVLNCRLRNVATGGRYVRGDKRAAARRLNREVTTIARVVVDPRFRGLGVAEALVRRALREARTGYVEALSALGRECRFFEKAGMRRYDQGMPAENARLVGALAREGKVVEDLAGLEAREVSGGLARELLRFARCGRSHGRTRRHGDATTRGELPRMNTDEHGYGREDLEWALGVARRRVGSWPAYYVWRRRGARVPGLVRIATPRLQDTKGTKS